MYHQRRLGILLPTNNPLEWGTCLGPSLKFLSPLAKQISVEFLYHFQGPWTPALIQTAVKTTEAAGFTARWCYSEQRPYSAYKLRADAARLSRQCDYYMLCDDNVIFATAGTPLYPRGSAERYAQVIEYFEDFPRCGVVTCEGSLGGSFQREAIMPTTSALMATARGLFFRNVNGGKIHTDEEESLIGGLGESVLAYGLMAKGYFIAKSMNHPTRHVHLTKVKGANGILKNDAVLHEEGLEYIRRTYHDRWWTHSSGAYPRTLVEQYKAIGADMRAIYSGIGPHRRSTHYRKEYP